MLSPRFDRLDNSLISELYIKGFLKYASVLMMLEVSKFEYLKANSCSDPRPHPGGEGGLALLPKDEPEAGAVLQGRRRGGLAGQGPRRG